MTMQKYRAGVLFASLCMGVSICQPLHAASVDYDDHRKAGKPAQISFNNGEESPASWFGEQTSMQAKHLGQGDRDTFLDEKSGKPDWVREKIDWHAGADKWENHKSHLDDDKWDKHANGYPGPIDNPCQAKYCGLEPPTAVPVPAAAWLLGSGLLGLIGMARRIRG
ncbi:MAG: hypothetical protein ACLGH6_01590 [Gammaproteobacteria bacterium]